MIKKISNYMYDCVREAFKSSAFHNLKSNKANKIVVTNATEWAGDDKGIIEVMTKAALNKATMNLIYGEMFLAGERGKQKFYTPLIYSDCELKRAGGAIVAEVNEEKTLNIGAISCLLGDNAEEVENIIEQLMEVPINDFETVLKGLVNLDGLEIVKQKAVILAKLPDATSGLLNELKQISELY